MTIRELGALFTRERARFARRYPQVRSAGLVVVPKPAGLSRRAMAFANDRIPVVALYLPAVKLPRANIVGLIRHELGHIAAPDLGEQAADDAAEDATGQRVRYDSRMIQTTGRGRYPRPRNLHR